MLKELDAKYTLIEKVFEGHSGAVYKARDTGGGDAAVKILKRDKIPVDGEDAARLCHELDILSAVSHPGVLKIYGYGYLHGDMYVASEYVGHPSMESLFRQGYSFSFGLIMEIFIQLAGALSFLHKNKIIHYGLKPSHVLLHVDEESRELRECKIIDCAVSRIKKITADDGRYDLESLVYMSPEQMAAANGLIDERSDLYSLGAIMYRMCAGVPAFQGDSFTEISRRKLARCPAGPSSINSAVSGALDRVIMKLIDSDADHRYRSAWGLLDDLKKIKNGEGEFLPGLADKSYRLTFHTRFIGRERELDQLKEAHHDALSAKGGLCLIRGKPGVGKTRFVHEFSSQIPAQGIFLRGKCYCFEKNEPYSPFKEALSRYEEIYNAHSTEKKQIIKDHIRKNAGGVGEILVRFSPFLYEIVGDSPILVKLDPDREKKRVLYALALFFLSLAKIESGLVLFLDDLQWLDDDGFDLLHELIHRIAGCPFLIIGTYRETEVGPEHGLNRFMHKSIWEEHSLTTIHIKPLGKEHLNQLVEELFHDSGDVVKRIADAIYRRNSGNPFYTIEAVRELVEKDVVYYYNKWTLKEEDFDVSSTHAGDDIVEHIVKSLTIFTETDREILSCAALSGIRFSPELLYYYNTAFKKPVSDSKIKRVIEKAVGLHLVEVDSSHKDFYIFTHDRIQESLIEAVPPEIKKSLHQLIAEFIVSHYSDSIENHYYDLVNHYTHAGDTGKLLTYSRLAGLKARGDYAFDEAVAYFETALSILEKTSQTGSALWLECMEQAAELYLIREDAEKSITAYLRLLPFTADKATIINAYLQISLAYIVKSINYKESEKYAKIGLRLLGEKLPVKKSLMPMYLLKETVVRLLHALFPFLFIQKKTRNDQRINLISSFYYVLSWIYTMSDKIKFARSALRILNLCESKQGPSKDIGMAMCAYGLLLMALKSHSRALEWLQKSLEMRRHFKDTMGVGQSYYIMGIFYQWNGNYDMSLECLHKSMDIYSWIGSEKDISTILLILHRIYIDTGEHDKALAYIHELKSIGYKMQNRYSIMSAFTHHALLAYQQGDYAGARQLLHEALDMANAEGSHMLQCSVYFRLGAVYCEMGDIDRSLSMSLEAERLYRNTPPLNYYSSELFCRIAEAYIRKYRAIEVFSSGAEKRKLLGNADKYTKKAMRIAGKWPTHRGDALRLRAEYYALQGNTAKANALFSAAIEQSLKINKKYDLAMAYFSFGNLKNALNEDAREYWRRAYVMFSGINSKVYAGKLKSLLGIQDTEIGIDAKPTMLLKQADAVAAYTRLLQDIGGMESGRQVLGKIIAGVLKISGAQRACLFINKDKSDQSLQILAAGGLPTDRELDHIILKIAALALKKQKIIQGDDAVEEENLHEFAKTIKNIKSLFCIPVSYRNRIRAVLYLDNSDSSFSVPDEIFPIINALIIQAVTETILNPESADKKMNGFNQERFDHLCESSHITNKEKQVLMLLLNGHTKKQIADEQSISINTVKHHISNIYDKTAATSREELMELFCLPDHRSG
jgi:predicted ATPase/DNA-binding NarL/FixJ family response regulator